jgi:hypothetical protein
MTAMPNIFTFDQLIQTIQSDSAEGVVGNLCAWRKP